eukprot:s163_g7.t1
MDKSRLPSLRQKSHISSDVKIPRMIFSTSRCDFANCASKMLSDDQRTPRYLSHVVRQVTVQLNGGENPPLVFLFQAGKRSRCVEPLVKRRQDTAMDQVAIFTKEGEVDHLNLLGQSPNITQKRFLSNHLEPWCRCCA